MPEQAHEKRAARANVRRVFLFLARIHGSHRILYNRRIPFIEKIHARQ